MDFLYLLHELLRKKWIVIFCTLIGLAAGVAFYFLREREYISLSQYSTGFTMEKKVRIQEGTNNDFYQINTRFNNVTVAFASDKVLGMLTYKLVLHDLEDKEPFRTIKPELLAQKGITASDLDFTKRILRQKIRDLELLSAYIPSEKKVLDLIKLFKYDNENLYKKTSLERVENTDFINIFARSENPHLSAFMANTAGDQLIRFFNNIYGERIISASDKLDSLTKVKKILVDSLSSRLQNFKAKTGPATSGDKATAAMGVVTELYGKYQEETRELNRLKAEKSAIETQLANLGSVGVTPTTVSTSGNNKIILQLRQRNEDLQKEMEGKSEDQKKKIQEEIDANISKIVQLSSVKSPERSSEKDKKDTRRDELVNRKIELESQILAAERNVEQFKNEKNKYEALINVGGGDDVMVQQMERDLELATKEYERLRQSYQGALDNDVNPENNFKQTTIGMPAEKPSPGRSVIIAGMSGTIMFSLSSLVILLIAFMDSSYKTGGRFAAKTGLSVLGSITKMDLKGEDSFKLLQPGDESASEESKMFLESMRKLRHEIEESGKRIILVTSIRPSEGKTFFIESLATALSFAQKKVLLIDANLSNNELTRRFNSKPVLDKLSVPDESKFFDKWEGLESMTPIQNTTIIGCNAGDVTPSELLPKNNIFKWIKKLKETYDYILIEASCLNNHSDSRELANYVDGILLVAGAANSSTATDKDSFSFISSTGDKFIGAVLNGVEKRNLDL